MTIDIDEKLLAKALDLSGAKTKKEAVRKALDEYVWRKLQDRGIDMIVSGRLAGTVHWTPEEFKAWRDKSNEKIWKRKKELEEKGVAREPAR
jgi:hypothetical protein